MSVFRRDHLAALGAAAFTLCGASAQNFSLEGGIVAGGGGMSTGDRFSLTASIGEAWAGHAADATSVRNLQFGFGTAVTPAFLAPAPALRADRSGPRLTLSWPAMESRFLLQETTEPAGGDWSESLSVPTLEQGRWVAEVETSVGRFFRLVSADPVLSIQVSGAFLEVSWISPDPRFVLQENLDGLAVAGWRDVATATRPVAEGWVVRLPRRAIAGAYRLRRR